MKYREKIVQIEFLDDEERVIRRLQAVYNQSLIDITQKANALLCDIYKIQDKYNSIEDEQERETLKSMERSKVYQKQYQDALKTQVRGILDKMHQKEFKTVNEYLNGCYNKAFTGNMYVLHGEGIPLIVPIDQEKVVRAVQINSKINKGLYSRLGEDVDLLKRKITAQISRGVATGMSYSQMAQQLAGYTKIGYNNAVRITRTEGHRIQQESTMDACYAARERGADVVKQWDATMDANTRESHQMVDGEIRALDEKFSNGLMYPGDPSGSAAEVINCRCVLLQRAKWALDQKELDRLKERASFYGLDKEKEFNRFSDKYLKAIGKTEKNEELTLRRKERMSQRLSQNIQVANKYGQSIQFDWKGDEYHGVQERIIRKLANEYNTRLQYVTVGAKKAAGTVDMSGSTMKLSQKDAGTAVHEFAHTMANSAADKYGLTNDRDFWKEIRKIRRAYKKDIDAKTDTSKWISGYEHGSSSIDEFFAEAFTQAKMKELEIELPSKYGSDFTYSNMVLAIVNKYFKKV